MASSRRKHRAYEATCDCASYPFPHRMFGGSCKGTQIAADTFDNNAFGSGGDCATCVMNDCYTCQVLEGLEDTKHAPCVQEFIQFNGIAAPVKWRSSLSVYRGSL